MPFASTSQSQNYLTIQLIHEIVELAKTNPNHLTAELNSQRVVKIFVPTTEGHEKNLDYILNPDTDWVVEHFGAEYLHKFRIRNTNFNFEDVFGPTVWE